MIVTQMPAHTSQQRRARALCRSLATRRPVVGLLAAELMALAIVALAAAALVGLFA